MRANIMRLGAATGSAVLLLAVAARGQEKKVALDKVPKQITDTVKARFQGARITGAGQETEEGKPLYEITIRHEGRNIDVTLNPKGEILLIEKEITARNLPRPVAAALENKYPKATYKIVEEIVKVENRQEKQAYYEVLLVTADKKALEVEVTAEGKVIHEEKKDAEKDSP